MKLAEALNDRASLNQKLNSLKKRMIQNSKVQEGDEFDENPLELYEEYKNTLKEHLCLVKRINKTNSSTSIGDQTLEEALLNRENMKSEQKCLKELIDFATEKSDRYNRSEIKYVKTVNISELQKLTDSLAKKYRELDTKIQQLNWNTDLL
ncbi:MAG: DIP1984 family protein [Candidatus Delongbacteria bacterium]|nr:DIP1984 family protein [Candidatus Delongbacteria bacterium]MBN2835301.1 DIP1984 family protein [Candidatus Delongbacteria bacterium]